jgi:valyl-tRNA synthetase
MIKRTPRTSAVKNTDIPAEEPVAPITESTPETDKPLLKTPVKRAPRTAAKVPVATAKTPVKPASANTPKAIIKRTTGSTAKTGTITPEIIEISTIDKKDDEQQPIEDQEVTVFKSIKDKLKDAKNKQKAKKEKAKRREKEIKAVIKKLEKEKKAKLKAETKKKEKAKKEKEKAKAKLKKLEKKKDNKGKSKKKK